MYCYATEEKETEVEPAEEEGGVEGEGGEGGEEGEEEEEEFTPLMKFKIATSIFGILTFLLLVTIIFEAAKEYLLEKTSENMKPVIETLFSEMTVLGFLSLFTFTVSKAGALSTLSLMIFEEDLGEEEGEAFLEEMFESIHYDLFLVMVLYIMQVLFMIKLGMSAEKEWSDQNKLIGAPDEMHKLLERFNQLKRQRSTCFGGQAQKEMKAIQETFRFASIKKEFICGRDVFTHIHDLEDAQLSPDFDYGQYLTFNMSKIMAEIVEITTGTWAIMWIFLLFFTLVMWTSQNNMELLAWVWVGVGYGLAFMVHIFKSKVALIKSMHVCPEDVPHVDSVKSTARLIHKVASSGSIQSTDTPLTRMAEAGASTQSPSAVSTEKTPLTQGEAGAESSSFLSRVDAAFDDLVQPVKQKLNAGRASRRSGINLAKEDIEMAPAVPPPSTLSPRSQANEASKHKSGMMPMTLLALQEGIESALDHDSLANKPGWCDLEPDRSRGFWQDKFCGVGFNAQHMLYWFRKNGPEAHCMILRLLCFIHAIYIAILILEFYGVAMDEFGMKGFGVYFLVGLLPIFYFYTNILIVIKEMVVVDTLGIHKKKDIISLTIREQKMARAIKSLMLLKNLRFRIEERTQTKSRTNSFASEVSAVQEHDQTERWERIKAELADEQIAEMGRMFDIYDSDGSGNIDTAELKSLMESLGNEMDDVTAANMVAQLDYNGDGDVSKEEFLFWMAEQSAANKDMSAHECVHALFSMFDKDGSGSITASEFMQALEDFKVGLNVDEVTDLIRELDQDQDGTISEEEFAMLLEKHAGSDFIA